jgi:hypothetical protein
VLGGLSTIVAYYMRAGAGVFVDELLNDDQRRWPVVKFLAPVGADFDVNLTAVLTDALGRGQFVMPGLAG